MPLLNDIIETLPQNHYFRDDIIFIIDADLRTILSSDRGNTIGAQGDHNVNRINFKLLRYYNVIDLSTFVIKINYITSDGTTGFYVINDLLIGDDYMLFTWLVSSNVTMASGDVSFVVKMVQQQSQDVYNVFSTAVSKGVVVPSIMMDNEIEELYRNVMERVNVYISTTPPHVNNIRPFSVWVQMAPTHDSMEIVYDTDVRREYVNELIILTKNGTSKANIYSGNGLMIECFINQILYCTTEGIQIIPYAIYVNGEWVSENVTIGVRISLKNVCVNINEESEIVNYVQTANINIASQHIDNEYSGISETLNVNASEIEEVYLSNMAINVQI